jgi:hypothetical protein
MFDVLKETVLTAAKKSEIPWDEAQYHGCALRTVRVGDGRIAPTYTTVDGFLIVALTPDYARELIDNQTLKKPNLTASAEFQKATAPLPPTGIDFTYLDFRGLYPHLVDLTQRIPANAMIDLRKLPATETVTKHLFPLVSATIATNDVRISHSYSPFGTPVGIAAAIIGSALIDKAATLPGADTTSSIESRPSSNTAVRRSPPENQTAASQTPTRQSVGPPPQSHHAPPVRTGRL